MTRALLWFEAVGALGIVELRADGPTHRGWSGCSVIRTEWSTQKVIRWRVGTRLPSCADHHLCGSGPDLRTTAPRRSGGRGSAEEVVSGLGGNLASCFAAPLNFVDCREPRSMMRLLRPANVGRNSDRTGFDPAVIVVDGCRGWVDRSSVSRSRAGMAFLPGQIAPCRPRSVCRGDKAARSLTAASRPIARPRTARASTFSSASFKAGRCNAASTASASARRSGLSGTPE
nr:hypothetical protein Hi04_10k_c4997_00017 [uncultured bacterium]